MKKSSVNVVNGKNVVKNHLDLGPDFLPPDGGWGWLITVAAGCGNLCTFPVLQQFGLLFSDRLKGLGISTSQITTIININSGFTSFIGLANGPMFRTFTYRKVAFFGATLVSIALILTSFANSFVSFITCFSILYGAGLGIVASANSLALNTYFKEKRRIATGLSWTTTAFGPIVCPFIITFLLNYYTVQGTVLIFAGFSMNAISLSLLLQPVQWHTKPVEIERKDSIGDKKINRNKSFLSNQYMYNADDEDFTGYEILDPSTPMLSRANDGLSSLYGSKASLADGRKANRSISKQNSSVNMKLLQHRERNASFYKIEEGEALDSSARTFRNRSNTFNYERELVQAASKKLSELKDENDEEDVVSEKSISFFQKIAIFFDLDLLKDFSFINLMVGITIANFAELNFSILTPFILADFGFVKHQIAMAMSMLGVMDICCRFTIPFIAERVGWQNRTFFLFGILGMAGGRIIIAHFHSYNVLLAVACWIGFNKGLRTVFLALLLPTHVPLSRLPGATGLQLLFSGIFFFSVGPLVGYIRDSTNYVVTLHCLNVATFLTAICWISESIINRAREKADDSENSK